jgi:hypothetical protein
MKFIHLINFSMKDMKAVVVFTGKDLNIMRTEGSGYWHARTDRLNDAEYLIAVRNRRNVGSKRPETRHSLPDCQNYWVF